MFIISKYLIRAFLSLELRAQKRKWWLLLQGGLSCGSWLEISRPSGRGSWESIWKEAVPKTCKNLFGEEIMTLDSRKQKGRRKGKEECKGQSV